MSAKFASTGDLAEKRQTFARLGDGVYCLTAEGDPNSGVIIGDDGVMVIDARATPVMARQLVELIRGVTDKPIKYVVLTHYHAVRVLGASAYGAEQIIASESTRALIVERGRHDMKSEIGRFPRLFDAVETIPGLTWPTMTFKDSLTIWMGKREVRLMHLGPGHTKGDTVVWLPKEKILFSGDLVEEGATPYCGDAYLAEWPDTLERVKKLGARKLVPGRGEAMMTPRAALRAIEATQAFLRAMTGAIRSGVRRRQTLKQVFDATTAALKPLYGRWVIFEHCMPFNVTRGYDEAKGIKDPRIWTAQRDREMWRMLQR
ncbi:MAG: MBL fold metallo-hydrolase [Alphaproteobacteria bacterium]|nr:MBL fold metallo-hydrolase [Alphaproteobacteria bacterium]